MKITSEQEMLKTGEALAAACPSDALRAALAKSSCSAEHVAANALPRVIELIGDVGVGKTTFVRGLAKGLGVKEPVTSPSFTISKSYATRDGKVLTHYDFYRLSDVGLMQDDLNEKLNDPGQIVVIEWGEAVKDFLPENHLTIEIKLNDDGSRDIIMA